MEGAMGVASTPVPPTPLIGRAGELAAAGGLLDVTRMVTLVGPAGSGKTRLAVEVFRDRGVFVDLAPLRDAAQVVPAVGRALGLRDAGARPITTTTVHHLREHPVPLLLDNIEHVLDAAGDVADLLAACPGVRVLATSRAPLHLPGERLLPVGPLPVPDPRAPLMEIGAVPSVALFVERVRAGQPDFALTDITARAVAEVCVALDGLPLALELAAGRVRAYGLDEVLAGTRERLVLLRAPRRAGPSRHRSLADAVRWSVDLLDDAARRVFAELSVFAGGFTADAARAVCGSEVLPVLAELVDHSLVVADTAATGVRYRMLETLRDCAADLLEHRQDADAVRRRHLAWCTGLAVRGATAIHGDGAGFTDADAEYENLQLALDRCADADDGLRLATALTWFWDVRGHLAVGRAHLERLLQVEGTDLVLRGRALAMLGRFSMNQDDHDGARRSLDESLRLLLGAGDRSAALWTCLVSTISAIMDKRPDLAAASAERAAGLAGPDRQDQGEAHFLRALALWCGGHYERGFEAMAVAWAVRGPDVTSAWVTGRMSFFVGWFAHLAGDDVEAQRLQREGALLLASVGDRRSVVDCLDVMGCVAAHRGEPVSAVRLFAAAAQRRVTTGLVRHRYLHRHIAPHEVAARTALGTAVHRVGERARGLTVADLVAGPGTPRLTAREQDVARLVADGLTNRQIGRRLGISERTAERHVENLRAKLGLASRTQVAAHVASGAPT